MSNHYTAPCRLPFRPPHSSTAPQRTLVVAAPPPSEQSSHAGVTSSGDKDLGALLHLKTLILLNAEIEAVAQRIGSSLEVPCLSFDPIDEEDRKALLDTLATMFGAPAAGVATEIEIPGGTHVHYTLELADGGGDRRADERNFGEEAGLADHYVEEVLGRLGKLQAEWLAEY